jgi:hypothetical protein
MLNRMTDPSHSPDAFAVGADYGAHLPECRISCNQYAPAPIAISPTTIPTSCCENRPANRKAQPTHTKTVGHRSASLNRRTSSTVLCQESFIAGSWQAIQGVSKVKVIASLTTMIRAEFDMTDTSHSPDAFAAVGGILITAVRASSLPAASSKARQIRFPRRQLPPAPYIAPGPVGIPRRCCRAWSTLPEGSVARLPRASSVPAHRTNIRLTRPLQPGQSQWLPTSWPLPPTFTQQQNVCRWIGDPDVIAPYARQCTASTAFMPLRNAAGV